MNWFWVALVIVAAVVIFLAFFALMTGNAIIDVILHWRDK